MVDAGFNVADMQSLGDLFSQGPVVLFKWDNAKNWPVLSVSPNAASVFGRTSKEFTSGAVTYGELIHTDDIKRVAQETAKAGSTGVETYIHTPYRILRPDGEARWMEGHSRFVRDENGVIKHIVGYVLDVTDRLNMEQARRESETRYRIMLNTTPHGYWVIDDTITTVEVNPALCEMLGYAPEELVGTSPLDHVTDESRVELKHQVAQRVPGDQRKYELAMKTKDGRIKRVLVHATTLPEHLGPSRSFGLFTDITDLLETQQTLSTLWHALEQSPVGIIITDVQGKIAYANPYFTTMTGFEQDEIIGQNPRILKSDRTDPAAYANLWNTILEGKIWQGDLINTRKDGEIYWERQTIAPILDDKGAIRNFVAFKEDVTAYKSAMEAQVRAKEEAELANQAKSMFLANMSHELRTPLNAIIGFSDMMRAGLQGELPKAYGEYAELIYDSGTHLLGIINDILDMTKVEANTIELNEEDVKLDNLAFESITLLSEKARRAEVGVQNRIPADCRLRADPLRLKQVLLNLVSNAITFSPGGEAFITTSQRFGRFAITVSDTGRGMSADEIATALKPFGQNRQDAYSSQGQGLGLGLPITKRLVEAHGGGIEIESQPGHGTAVHVLLPADRVLNAGTWPQ